MTADLMSVADELYSLPLEAFTSARNQRAKDARLDDKALAKAIKILPKPSTAAWVVNMLVRHLPEQVDQVLSLGAALRQAQADLNGEQLRELTTQRRQLTAAVTTQARVLADELGSKVSDAVAAQVDGTLHAAMIDRSAAAAVRSGLLTEALSATGLGDVDVSGAVAVPSAIDQAAPSTSRPARKRAELTVVRDAERALEDSQRLAADAERLKVEAQKKLDKAIKRVANFEARSMQIQGQLEEVRRRAGELEHELEEVDEELATARRRVTRLKR